MKLYPSPPLPPPQPSPHRHKRRPRIPSFNPVPMRRRRDGWTAERQAAFIGYLAQTRCVTSAAREVGMARETAYRLRRHPWASGFCAAWDAALVFRWREWRRERGMRGQLERPQDEQPKFEPRAKVTNAELRWRMEAGLVRPVMVHGRFIRVLQKPDNSALFQLIRRIDSAENAIARYDVRAAARAKSQSLKPRKVSHPAGGSSLLAAPNGREG